MGKKELWAVRWARIGRWFGARHQAAVGWMSRPTTIVWVILGGYFVIAMLWFVYRAYKPPQLAANEKLVSWERFSKDTAPFWGIWAIGVTVIKLLASMTHRKWDDALRLRASQKERIRILDNFQPTKFMIELYDNQSIYDSILSMLYKLDKQDDDGAKKANYMVCMLLCSPALDYWGNEKSLSPTGELEWGLEFRNIVRKLADHQDIQFDVCHLPLEPFSGVNALRDFIAALTTYIIQSEGQFKSHDPVVADADFQKTFDTLWRRSELVARDFAAWSSDHDTRKRFDVKTHMINIPFQVVLIDSKEIKEVVVSFAGREVLEREQRRGVKGFFSSDPYVVKTFREVFRTYVDSRGRIPYLPKHTSGVSDRHDAIGPHVIPEYYFNLVGPLHILPETFSPIVGNSTKFTVWVLDKLLTTGLTTKATCWGKKAKKILDVGSGSGVLAIASGAILRQHCGNTDYQVTAIESCPHAQKVLIMNASCDARIKVKPWTLCFQSSGEGGITDAWFEDDKRRKVSVEGDFVGFDLITADLPFVHARKRSEKDLRFLDLDHNLHQALFRVVAKTNLLASDGLLVTAFSSLGGPEDIAEFERHVRDNELQVIQRVDFFESGYMWMVYVLMKRVGYDAHRDRLWWKFLDAERHIAWNPPAV